MDVISACVAQLEAEESFHKETQDQLAAAQARIKELRGALNGLQTCIDPDVEGGYKPIVDEIIVALATPDDSSALDAALRAERERCAHYAELHGWATLADELRSMK
jgi:hypothetical protein